MPSTVIIVEDIAPMRTIIRTVLKAIGISEIIDAPNGVEALKILEQRHKQSGGKPADLIICDWNMPHMTGIELLTKIRTESNFKKLPFLMLTAQANEEHLREAITAGASDYVVKPFQARTLESKVRALLG